MAGPILVEGPDGQKYEFPEGTAPEVMKSAMAKRYPKPSAPTPKPYEWNEAAAIEGGKFGASAPPSEAEMAGWMTAQPSKMGRGSSAMLGVLDVGRNVGGAVDAIGEALPTTAAPLRTFKQATGGQGPVEMAFKTIVDAPTNVLMAAPTDGAGLIEALLSEQASQESERLMTKSLKDNPVSTRLGQGVGMTAGGGAQMWNRGEKVLNAAGKSVAKFVGVDKPGKVNAAARYGGRLSGLGALGAADYAAYNAGFEGENQTRETGEKVSGYEIARDELGNPMAWAAAPAASIIFRAGRAAVTGQATPASVKLRVDAALSPTTKGGEVLPAEVLGTIDPRAEKLLIRMLARAGFTKDDIARAIERFEVASNQETDLAVLPSRLKDVLIEQLGDDAAEPIQRFLQGAGVSAGTPASGFVRTAVTEDYGRLADFLHDSANARLGSKSRFDTLTQAEQEMERLGKEAYERIFSQPARNPQELKELTGVLEFYAKSDLNRPLKQVAAGKMLDVDQMIAKDPRRAAHLLQRAANMAAQDAFDKGDKILGNAYSEMRDNILTRLERPGVAPTYQEARQRFGDEFGTEQALRFGARFFTKTQDTLGTKQLAEEFANLTGDQQDAARMSVRDETLRIAGRGREGAAPRLAQLETESALSGLETVLGREGGQFANDIRYIGDRLRRTRAIDPSSNSRTVENTVARDFANEVASNPMAHALGVVLQKIGGDAAASAAVSTATGNPAMVPFLTARTALRNLGDNFTRGRQGKIDDLTALLLADRTPGAPRPPMPGDSGPVIPPRGGEKPATGFGEVMSKGGKVGKPKAEGFRNNERGSVNADVAAGLMYGSMGGLTGSFVDYNQDGEQDWKDMATGAGVGFGGAAALNRIGETALRNVKLPKSNYDRMWNAPDIQTFAAEQIRQDFKPKKITRAATQEDWEEAKEIAFDRLKRYYSSNRAGDKPMSAQAPGFDADDVQPRLVLEELTAAVLRNQGLDPDPVYMPMLAHRGTNAERRAMQEKFREVIGRLTGTGGTEREQLVFKLKNADPEDPLPIEREATQEEFDTAWEVARQMLSESTTRGRGGRKIKRGPIGYVRRDVENEAVELLKNIGVDGSKFRVVTREGDNTNVVALKPRYERPPRLNSFSTGNVMGDALTGAALGSAGGSQTDFNGDGSKDSQDMLIGALLGGAGATIGPATRALAKRKKRIRRENLMEDMLIGD
ncbi:hypothetical protein [Acidiphilium sp.]|uniref:hypothetical protein n=1 Tax=Acidiphilium sp. TaxID=527 RepID=UPI002590A9D2|nr:hypothetical protein [Acidiphilium sp.]